MGHSNNTSRRAVEDLNKLLKYLIPLNVIVIVFVGEEYINFTIFTCL